MVAYVKTHSYKIKTINHVFEIRIPDTGKKWQTDLCQIFETYYKNYLTNNDSKTDQDKIFLVEKKRRSAGHKGSEYVVPIKKNGLDKIGFGYLLKDIFLKHAVTAISKKGGVCLHASASVRNGRAVLFIGPSGMGKSTITKLIAPDLAAIADDSVFVVKEKSYVAYQPFWFEKQIPIYDRHPAAYPIRAICILVQSSKNRLVVEKDRQIIAEQLVDQTIYYDPTIEFKNLMTLANSSVPFYKLHFSLDGKIKDKILSSLFGGS